MCAMKGWRCAGHDMALQTCNLSQEDCQSEASLGDTARSLSTVLYPKLPEGGYRCRHVGSLISETCPSQLERRPFCKEIKKRSGLEARRFRDSSHHLLCGPRQTSQPFCSTVPTGKIELLTCCHSPTRSAFDFSVSKRDNRC